MKNEFDLIAAAISAYLITGPHHATEAGREAIAQIIRQHATGTNGQQRGLAFSLPPEDWHRAWLTPRLPQSDAQPRQ